METERREIYRYLGYGRHEVDEATRLLVEECVAELEHAADPKSFYREYPLTVSPDGEIDAGCFSTRSRALARNLQDCDRILLFGATLGAGVDRLIRRYSRIRMSRAVILQAASAAMVEAYCDEVNGRIRDEYEARGLYLRPRFSPGYGDFGLECQIPIFAALELGKRTGMTLTDSLLMAPSKSVTAVMGASPKPHRCDIHGCEACGKTDCAYRR